jgi:hypothetical protein
VTASGNAGTYYVSGNIIVNGQSTQIGYYAMGGLNETVPTEEATAVGNTFTAGTANEIDPWITFPYFTAVRGTSWEGSCTTSVQVVEH